MSSYLGSGADVSHYAYLSSRYSEIAREHSNLMLSQERLAKMDMERQRMQLALREAKLASAQQQGAGWKTRSSVWPPPRPIAGWS